MTYRRDIDGLRAIAVLAVVFYHFGVPGFGGGFVGVDIFFVISGFLIGGLLWDELHATGRLSLSRFYARRIRRLAPAYGVMVLASAAVGWLLLLPFEFREFGKTVIAATVYLSNVLFYRQTGYFDGAAEEKPLLHTWSLAVEEQFYIVLPLALALLWRWRFGGRRTTMVLVLACAASLLASLLVLERSPAAAFFLFPYRAWELLAGVLLAIALRRPGGMPLSRPSTRAGLAWGGLLLLLGSVVLVRPGDGFPGVQALAPVAGTLMLIASGGAGTLPERLLTARGPVLVGLISYSLYLWHWPVLVLGRHVMDDALTAAQTAALLGASLALAYGSWRWVEQPFRHGGQAASTARVYTGGAALSAGLLALGGALYLGEGVPGRFDARTRVHIDASADFLQDWSRCAVQTDGPLAGLETCRIGPHGQSPEVLVWGDSHLRAWKEGIDRQAHDSGVAALLIWRAGCPPLFIAEKRESAASPAQDAACARANAQIRAALPQMDGLRRVLLVGRWTYYAEGSGIGADSANRIAITPPLDQAMAVTLAQLGTTMEQVFVLRQPPEIADYDSRHVARQLARGQAVGEVDTIARTALASRFARADAALRAAVVSSNTRLIDPWPGFCDATHCHALGVEGGRYFDNNHITNSAALRLRQIFAPVFATGAVGEVSHGG